MKPRYIAYTIWLIIVLLGGLCCLVPDGGWTIGSHTLRWPTLTQALDLELSVDSCQLPVDILPLTIDSVQSTVDRGQSIVDTTDSIKKKPQPIIPTVNIANTDTRAYLSTFYAALDSASTQPIRVVHYGDSQIEEDRITGVLREQWQKQYGGGGPGLLPLHQTIPTRTIRQWLSINGVVQTTQGGPKRYIVYGPRSMRLNQGDEYGVMGQVARMDTTLVPGSQTLTMNIEPIDKKRRPHNYFNRIRLLADSISSSIYLADTIITASHHHLISLPDSTTRCELHLQGQGNVYGISLESATGIIVDNIPMRGCSGNIFTRIDSIQLADFYRETNTRLIILQFGGNMIPQTENPSTISGYVRTTLRQQIRYIRQCAPQASILFIGPSDMSTRIDGQMTTYPLVPYMDKLLKQMAEEEHIAYWSLYDAMGGYNSMVHWVEVGLAGSDYIHFTRAGANKIGKQLFNWLNTKQ